MIDKRFYRCISPLPIEKLAEISESEIHLPRSGDRSVLDQVFENASSLEEAALGDLALFHNPKYRKLFEQSRAGVCFASSSALPYAPPHMALLISPAPQRSFGLALSALYPSSEGDMVSMQTPLHATAVIGEGTVIEYGAVIKDRVRIGRNCRIGANSVIGSGVEIGDHTWIGSQVTLSHALVGSSVVIYPGARIGQAGFGFAMDGQGFVTVPQLGRVVIEDHVEIGANTTVDRGSLRDTIIGRGARLDNLVMIGHNVEVGPGSILVAQVGIAGSTRLGKHVIAGGQVGIAGHLTVGDGVRIAAQSGVMRSIESGQTVMGSPAFPMGDYLRQVAVLNKMSQKTKEPQKK